MATSPVYRIRLSSSIRNTESHVIAIVQKVNAAVDPPNVVSGRIRVILVTRRATRHVESRPVGWLEPLAIGASEPFSANCQ